MCSSRRVVGSGSHPSTRIRGRCRIRQGCQYLYYVVVSLGTQHSRLNRAAIRSIYISASYDERDVFLTLISHCPRILKDDVALGRTSEVIFPVFRRQAVFSIQAALAVG